MAEISLNMDSLPDSPSVEIEENTPYEVKITRAEPVLAGSGSQMLQLDLQIIGTDSVVRYDNTVVTKADGSLNRFGLFKLKRIIQATNVSIEGDFKIKLLATLLVNKSFIAFVRKKENNKGKTVFELGHPDSYSPIENQPKENTEPSTVVIAEQPQLKLPKNEVISTEDW